MARELGIRSPLPGAVFEGLRMLSGVIAVAVLGVSLAWLARNGDPRQESRDSLNAAPPAPAAAPLEPAPPLAASNAAVDAAPEMAVLYLVDPAKLAQVEAWGQVAAGETVAGRAYHFIASEEELREAALRIAEASSSAGKPVQLDVIDLR